MSASIAGHRKAGSRPIRRPLRVKMILPSLVEANAPGYRPIKYALFPPLGLAGLAGYLDPDDEVELLDEHVQAPLALDDVPDLLVMTVYITSARRAWEIADLYRARGTYVCVGGLHPTSLPDEAALHADTVVTGPGEGAWQAFLADFRAGRPEPRYDAGRRHALARGHPARASRSDRAPALPVPQLDRGVPRLSAPLRLLLQGRVLRGRPVVLHADGRRGARGDRPSPRQAPLLPRRPSAWATGGSPRGCSRACAGWAGCSREPAPCRRSCAAT